MNVQTEIRPPSMDPEKVRKVIIANAFALPRMASEFQEDIRRDMTALARNDGHKATRFDERLLNQNKYQKEITAKRKERLHRIMCILAENPTTRIDMVALLGISDGQHFVDLFTHLEDGGLITMTRARPRSYFTITDEGRAWLAEQGAGECI